MGRLVAEVVVAVLLVLCLLMAWAWMPSIWAVMITVFLLAVALDVWAERG